MVSSTATVEANRRERRQRPECCVGFPRDLSHGDQVGRPRWLRVQPQIAFRPLGFMVWGASDVPPKPFSPKPGVPSDVSWAHRFLIAGADELVTEGGFALHYFRVPRPFDALCDRFRMTTGAPLLLPTWDEGFTAIVTTPAGIKAAMGIPRHCELDFAQSAPNQTIELEVSGLIDRVVMWGVGVI